MFLPYHGDHQLKSILKTTCALFLALTSFSSTAVGEDNWKFEIVPYAWLAGIDADVTVGNRTAAVDIGFDDLIDSADLGGSFLSVTQYKQWVLWTQFDYFKLNTDVLKDNPVRARFKNESLFATAAIGYQFHTFGEYSTIDVLGGARYLNIDNTINADSVGSLSRSNDLVDGIFMIRPNFQLLSWLRFNPTLSVGAGDSDLTYELQPQLHFQITDHLIARVGYRRLFYNAENSRGEFDGSFHGFIAGLGGSF